MNLDRLESLIGLNNVVKLRNLNILIVGLGGVGGYVFESLLRSGVGRFTIVDGDQFEETNLNRQLLCTHENIGNLKVVEANKHAREINKDVIVSYLNVFLDKNTIKELDFKRYDYVVDACDDIEAKVLLINKCMEEGIKIISSMGTAKKMHADKLAVTKLSKTSYDPLAKKLRKLISKEYHKNVVVVSSTEEVKDTELLGSNAYVPGIAGLLITDYIVNDVCEKTE